MDNILNLFHALKTNNCDNITLILSNNSDINDIAKSYQMSPLCLAIKHGCSFEVIEQLVNSNINLNDGISSLYSLTYVDNNPLVLACKHKNLKVMKLLIEKGAIVDVKDCFCVPILHEAVKNGIEYVKLLVLNGADPNSVNKSLESTLHVAIESNSPYELVNFLLRSGVDTSAKNCEGDTAVALALKKEDLNPAIRIMLQTTMAQRKKNKTICFPKSIKRKFMLTEPEILKDNAEKAAKKLKSNEAALSSAYFKQKELEKKWLTLVKNCEETRKQISRYIDDGLSLFGVRLDCPICLEDFVSGCSIYQCINGHLLCDSCHTRLTTCPQCNVAIKKIRNRALESLVEGMNSGDK